MVRVQHSLNKIKILHIALDYSFNISPYNIWIYVLLISLDRHNLDCMNEVNSLLSSPHKSILNKYTYFPF